MINANTFYIFSGFGKVIRAIQKSTGKVVAIKSMSVEDEKMLNLTHRRNANKAILFSNYPFGEDLEI